MKLETTVKTINTKEDFINFLEILLLDFKKNNNSWENKSIDTYLEGMQSWVEDMEGYYINNNLPTLITELLMPGHQKRDMYGNKMQNIFITCMDLWLEQKLVMKRYRV